MKFTILAATLLTSVVSARSFTLYDDVNFGGAAHAENRNNDAACWNLNGAGDHTSSVKGGSGCTTFFHNWQQRGNAFTVPDFLNDHIWSYRNQC
ncbi:uncharacterized protein J7T55_015744 [Diaporthe amygdali]|uniref:uncharacterized protein n=1 Tax=Phomopsis amygdali TaxID=1214568 RepID=UPI0022FDCE4F|nr:uncharacterized protein J7T55_015744 [Diaporthe amygdali]KAJ0107279.1 uncharacterized protein J7T55_015744 [Diaporthe amygdali]